MFACFVVFEHFVKGVHQLSADHLIKHHPFCQSLYSVQWELLNLHCYFCWVELQPL